MDGRWQDLNQDGPQRRVEHEHESKGYLYVWQMLACVSGLTGLQAAGPNSEFPVWVQLCWIHTSSQRKTRASLVFPVSGTSEARRFWHTFLSTRVSSAEPSGSSWSMTSAKTTAKSRRRTATSASTAAFTNVCPWACHTTVRPRSPLWVSKLAQCALHFLGFPPELAWWRKHRPICSSVAPHLACHLCRLPRGHWVYCNALPPQRKQCRKPERKTACCPEEQRKECGRMSADTRRALSCLSVCCSLIK